MLRKSCVRPTPYSLFVFSLHTKSIDTYSGILEQQSRVMREKGTSYLPLK
jgi:hypothetical protein